MRRIVALGPAGHGDVLTGNNGSAQEFELADLHKARHTQNTATPTLGANTPTLFADHDTGSSLYMRFQAQQIFMEHVAVPKKLILLMLYDSRQIAV